MTKALELAKFGRESAPAGLVVGDSDAQTLSQKTFSDMPTFSGGTANSLAYLNGSKVLTADGALGYDGTTFSTSISVNSQAASIYTRNTNTGTSAWAGLTIGNDISNNRSGILVTSSNRAASGFVGPQSTYIYNSVGLISLVAESNNPIYIGTNNTTRITVLGGGNVGVGIQAPTAILHTQSSGLGDGGGIKLGNSGSGGGTFAIWPTATINGEGADKLIFSGSGGNLFTVTGTGHVGIGTTNPRINTTSVTAGVTTLTIYNSAAGGGGLELATGSTVNTASTGRLAFIAAGNTDGSRNIAWIDSLIQGTTSGNQGGNMRFAVKADNAAVATGMTLDSTGLGIGTAPNSNGRLSVYETTVAKLFLTDSTLGTSYGGQVRGYGTTGAGGYLELGVIDANTYNSAIKVFNQATQISFYTNSGANGSTSERMRITSTGSISITKETDSTYWGNSPSIILTNRNYGTTGNIAGGIFASTYRDVVDPHVPSGIWFTRQNYGGVAVQSDIVFGMSYPYNEANTMPGQSGRMQASTGNFYWGTGTSASNAGISGTASLYVNAIALGGQSNENLYMRRNTSGQYAFQTYYNSSNSGDICLQPYGGTILVGTTSKGYADSLQTNASTSTGIVNALVLQNSSNNTVDQGVQLIFKNSIYNGAGIEDAKYGYIRYLSTANWGEQGALLFGTNNGYGVGPVERMRIDAAGSLVHSGRKIHKSTDNISIASGGTYIMNLEALAGLMTTGLLYVRGNENGVNQTLAIYSFNISFYGYSTNSRYITLKQVHRNTSQNGYGDVYAYLSDYSSSYTSTDQAMSGTSTNTTNIYFRNAVGQACNANYSLYVQG